MDRRAFLAGAGLLAAGGLAGCAADRQPAPQPRATGTPTPVLTRTGGGTPDATPSATLRNGSFEDALWGWFLGTDLPDDPETGRPVDATVRVTGFGGRGQADAPTPADGAHALSIAIDGRQDDGTVWAYQPVELGDVSTLSVAVYSERESFNTITKVAAYAGPGPGRALRETDFDTSRPAEDHAGWKRYDYPVAHDGAGVVAVGISVVWETEVTRYLDAVALS